MSHVSGCATEINQPCNCITLGFAPRAVPAAAKLLPSQVLVNALRDPSYRPYCIRCDTFERMQSVGHLQWRCPCGGGHDAREELEALLRYPLPNGYSPKDATDVAPAAAAQTAAARKFVVPGLRNAAEAIANMGGHVPGIAHMLKILVASYREDALRYRALSPHLSVGETDEGDRWGLWVGKINDQSPALYAREAASDAEEMLKNSGDPHWGPDVDAMVAELAGSENFL